MVDINEQVKIVNEATREAEENERIKNIEKTIFSNVVYCFFDDRN